MSRPTRSIHNCRHKYQDNLYIVQVSIVYKEAASVLLEMILDTGASYVCLPDEVFDALELVPVRTERIQTPSSVYNARIGVVEKIVLDDVVAVSGVEIATTPKRMARYSGLLGGSFLKEVGIYLDPRKCILRFHHDGFTL